MRPTCNPLIGLVGYEHVLGGAGKHPFATEQGSYPATFPEPLKPSFHAAIPPYLGA